MVAATTTRARYGLGGSLYSDLPRAGTRNLVVGAAMLSIFSAAIGQASEVPSTFRSQATRVANLHTLRPNSYDARGLALADALDLGGMQRIHLVAALAVVLEAHPVRQGE